MVRSLPVSAALAAAMVLSALPAQAQQVSPGRWSGHHERSGFVAGCGQGRDGRRDRSACGSFGDGWSYADGSWALYNNRSWGPDSFNDWWNDRPDRAYPRWVQEQRRRGTCEPDRMWWSGSGWHC